MTSSLTAAATHPWTTLAVPAGQILATVLVAVVVRALLHRAIDSVVSRAMERAATRDAETPRRSERLGIPGLVPSIVPGLAPDRERHRQRLATTGSLLRSLTSIVVFALALLTVMGILGVPLAPLIASAGVGGVALGFGAQSLVRDFLSGIFMIVEDQYGVGDVVDTGTVVGTVEDVSLRITRLRDGSGVVWYVRNGEVLRLGNHTQGWSTATVDVPLAYGQDVEAALVVLASTAAALDADPAWAPRLVRAPEVAGVEALSGSASTIRVVLGCAAGEADPVARELRRRLLPALDHAGLRLGTP